VGSRENADRYCSGGEIKKKVTNSEEKKIGPLKKKAQKGEEKREAK